MRMKCKRSLSLLLTLAMVMSLFCGNAWAAETNSKTDQESTQVEEVSPKLADAAADTEELPDYDIWLAKAMLFGYNNTGNGLYPMFRNFQDPVYRQLGGYMLDDTPLVALSATYTVYLNEEFLKNPHFIYETIIMSYLKYEVSSEEEMESELFDNAKDFATKIYSALVKSYDSATADLIKTGSKKEVEEILKSVDTVDGISKAISEVGSVCSTGKALFDAVVDYLALQKATDDRVLLLKKARDACAAMDNPNENFIKAADTIIGYMQVDGIIDYMNDKSIQFMIGDAIDTVWELVSNGSTVLKGVELSVSAIDLCFNTTSGAESNLKLALLYTADCYFQLGLMSASQAFMDKQTDATAARTFMACFRGYAEFQMYGNSYGKDWVDGFRDQQGLLAAFIQQKFYQDNLEESQRLSDLCVSQNKTRARLLELIEKYRSIYEKDYCDESWVIYLDGTETSVPVTGVQFASDTRTITLDSTEFYTGDATVTPSNASNQIVTYTSSDPEVLAVNDGFLVPLKVGTATLTATSKDGGYTAMQTIQVVASTRRQTIASGTCGKNLLWNLYQDGTLFISGSGTMTNWSSSSRAPWYGNRAKIKKVQIGKGVTGISDYAFWSCFRLTSVTIPDSVTSIGGYAFRDCSSITSVTIPASVMSIGDWAFYECSSLKSVYISDLSAWCKIDFGGNTANPLWCAYNLYLNGTLVTELVIPDSVTSIGRYAFVRCSGLNSVTIPDSVTSIGYAAFEDCSSLTSVSIPDSVTSIDGSTFSNCSSLTSVMIPNSVTSVGGYAFRGCSSLTSVTIPDSVTSIGYDAFKDCSNLTSVSIPDSVTSIGSSAFCDCSSLTSVTIPDSVTSIDGWTFRNCSSLTNVTIPDSVTSIGNEAFWGCSSLESVTIPDSVTSLGEYAFYGCSSLTSVTIPDSVTSIGGWAFDFCDSLKSVTIPDSVMSIGECTFNGCSSLTSVTIPDSVTSIGKWAFSSCDSLKDVYYAGSEEEWNKISIGDYNSSLKNATIHYNSTGPTDPVKPEQKKVESCTITLGSDTYTYDGKAKTPAVTVKDGAATLTSGKDYDVTYANNTDAGTAKVTITGKGDYTGTVTKEFTINKADQTVSATIAASSIIVGKTTQITASAKTGLTYSSSDTGVAAVSDSGLVTGKAAGTATITVKAEASKNYNQAQKTLKVTVTKETSVQKLSDCKVTLAATSYTYDGKAKMPAVTVKNGATTLTSGKDYQVSYANNTNAGTATVTVTGKENYTGKVTVKFTIKKAGNTITAANVTKTASTKAQSVSLNAKTKGGAKLTYKSNNKYVTVDKKGQVTIAKKFVGQATITINVAATANYNAATKKITVTVNPTGTKLTSVKSTKIGQLTIKWIKNAAVTGYQVQYATSGKFNGAKTLNVKSNKTVTRTLSKLKEKQKYYVRIRTYKTVGKVNYYSAWSAAKSATVKGVTAPAAVKLTSVKSAKAGEMTVKWGKNAKAGGYQLQYATAKNFKSAKTVAVKKAKTTSTTIKKLTKGKKYYVRIRTYQKVGGKTYYSAWSASKNVTIKK